MYYIKLSCGEVARIMKRSIARPSPSAADWQEKVLERN
jgi:hypothetical protein